MWMWPLDSAVGAIAAHRAPKRVVDGTCTRVWAWMTGKCRRRMNGREGYITTKITQNRGGGGRPEGPYQGERLLGCERSWEFPSSGEASFLLGMLGHPVLYIFHPKNKPSPHQSPTFGLIIYKFIVMGPVREPRPYKNKKYISIKIYESVKLKNNFFFLIGWEDVKLILNY